MIEIGKTLEQVIEVTDKNAITFLGAEGSRVLSTPQMIGNMEMVSRNLLLGMLEPGKDSVGTIVNVKHLGAAPMGTSVTFRSKLIAVEGRRATFEVEAIDDHEKIGEGLHERFIITVANFAEKMKAKLANQP
ncbi:MAG TPA: thioesterase family protein [Bryobacteraceae bacterium]|jgi:predicted thioesterase